MSKIMPKNINSNAKIANTTPVHDSVLDVFKQQADTANPFGIKGGARKKFVNMIVSSALPQDAVEAMLVTQMVAVHNLGMFILGRAATLEAKQDYTEQLPFTNAAVKLLNTYTRQIEALNNYRGRKSLQQLTVGHVNVEAGGQAIVGNVSTEKSKDGN